MNLFEPMLECLALLSGGALKVFKEIRNGSISSAQQSALK